MNPEPRALPRALLLEPQPFYTDRGTPIAVRQVLRALSELGWSVDVLTFPIGEPVDLPNLRLERVGNPLGFRHVAVGFSPQKLFLDGLMAGDLAFRLRRRRYDVIHAVEETGFLAAMLRGRNGPPIVYDMASSLPEQLAQKPIFRAAVLQRGLRAAERWLLTRAGCIICSAGLGEHAREMAPGANVREWRFPAELDLPPAGAVAALRAELQLTPTARTIVYSGNFASYQGIDLLLGAASEVLTAVPDAHLVCIGAATEAEIAQAAAALSPDVASRVRLIGRQPRSRVPLYLGWPTSWSRRAATATISRSSCSTTWPWADRSSPPASRRTPACWTSGSPSSPSRVRPVSPRRSARCWSAPTRRRDWRAMPRNSPAAS